MPLYRRCVQRLLKLYFAYMETLHATSVQKNGLVRFKISVKNCIFAFQIKMQTHEVLIYNFNCSF